jgi:S1-C subfamily serine protease
MASPPQNVAPRPLRGSGAYLGTRPAYGENVEGVKLEGVSDGSPAQKAGLQGGDILIKFAGSKITDIETYMTALSAKKPGDEVEIVVNRDGKEVTLKAVLGSRPSAPPAH